MQAVGAGALDLKCWALGTSAGHWVPEAAEQNNCANHLGRCRCSLLLPLCQHSIKRNMHNGQHSTWMAPPRHTAHIIRKACVHAPSRKPRRGSSPPCNHTRSRASLFSHMRKQNHHEIYHGSLTCTHVLLFLYAVAHQLVIVYYVNTVMCAYASTLAHIVVTKQPYWHTTSHHNNVLHIHRQLGRERPLRSTA